MTFTISAILKNIELRGTTMGSRREFADMVAFVKEKKLRPVISRVVQGLDLDELDNLFKEIKGGDRFGKLVVEISKEGESAKL